MPRIECSVAQSPDCEDHGIEADEIEPLQWKHIAPSSDPDLLAKIATYFDGMNPSESSDRLWAKCRLLPVEVYADAQIAAKEELRDE